MPNYQPSRPPSPARAKAHPPKARFTEVTRDGDWRLSGACAGEDPELHFPVGTTGPAVLQTALAKAVCQRCPVRERCLEWALETREPNGIWGGMDEAERRSLLRRQSRLAALMARAA